MMLIGQASESRLFTFSDETKNKLRKFRLGTSRAKDPQAIICKVESSIQSCCSPSVDQVNKKTYEIAPEDDEVYSDLKSVGEELPDHAPRFILLSYPLVNVCPNDPSGWADRPQSSGRQMTPYVMLYYLPVTATSEMKMIYAGCTELMRNTAEVQKILEFETAEELETIPQKLVNEA
jgi:hypothetical protein